MFICSWDFAAFPRESEIKDDDITYKVISMLNTFCFVVVKRYLILLPKMAYLLQINIYFKDLVIVQEQKFVLEYCMKHITSYPLKPITGTNTLSATSSEFSVT